MWPYYVSNETTFARKRKNDTKLVFALRKALSAMIMCLKDHRLYLPKQKHCIMRSKSGINVPYKPWFLIFFDENHVWQLCISKYIDLDENEEFNCWFDFPEETGLQKMLWKYRTYISNIKQFILTKKDLLLCNQNCIGWECFCKNAANYIYTSKYCTACHAVCVKGLRHMKFAINSCCLDILPMKVSHLLKHHADICYEWKNRTKYPIIYKYVFIRIFILILKNMALTNIFQIL